jgi:endogenous inhibitor of DNA gyrase (YacG/DUF329 family)
MTVVACPTCAKAVEWIPENRFRPFCSERCKQIDLGAWAEEKYTIPGAAPNETQDDPLADD